MKVINKSKDATLAGNAQMADTFLTRMIGLLNRTRLNNGEALIITKCQSIHMFFMKFAIDAVFVGKEDTVVGLVENIKPNRLSRIFFKANFVIELPVGKIKETGTNVGDRISITD